MKRDLLHAIKIKFYFTALYIVIIIMHVRFMSESQHSKYIFYAVHTYDLSNAVSQNFLQTERREKPIEFNSRLYAHNLCFVIAIE